MAWRRSKACDLLCIGEMGIGNTTIAAAIAHGLYGGAAEDWVGPGTGVDAARACTRKADAVRRAVALHRASSRRSAGSPAAAGRARARCHGRRHSRRPSQRVPVLLDGYVATAAAAVLHAMRSCCARSLPGRPSLGRAGASPASGKDRQGARCSIWACGLAKGRARRSLPPWSRPPLRCIPAWPHSRAPGSATARTRPKRPAVPRPSACCQSPALRPGGRTGSPGTDCSRPDAAPTPGSRLRRLRPPP